MRFTKYNNPAKRRKKHYSRPMPDDVYQQLVNDSALELRLQDLRQERIRKELETELWEKVEATGDVWHREEVTEDAE